MRLRLSIKDNLLSSDTETTGLNPWGSYQQWGYYPARPFAFSFCDTEGNQDYIRWEVNPFTRKVLVNSIDLKILKDLYSNPHLINIGHNFGYDYRMLNFTGIKVLGDIVDTLMIAHIVTGGSELSYALKSLGVRYLQIDTSDEKELQSATAHARLQGKKLGWILADKEHFGKEPIKADYWMAPLELCKKYALRDSYRAMLLYQLWYPEILENSNLQKVYAREKKLMRVVWDMENRGVKLFLPKMRELQKEYSTYMENQLKVSEKLGGKGLNFRSPKQMTHKFYTEKGYEPKINKSGNPSLNKDKLIELAQKDPLAQIILNYRGASHMLSAFLAPYDNFKAQDEKGEWVLHPNFKQCGPVTGRFSCSDPNLMCVASEDTIRNLTQVEYKPKRVLGPRKGYIWYLPDYKQIEVWVFAFLARDKTMMDALMSGRDIHSEIARQVWGSEPDFKASYDSYRKRAKLILFCKFYGGGIGKVMFLLNQEGRNLKKQVNFNESQKFVNDFDAKLPGIGRFMKRMMNQVEREGSIYNPFGRIYRIDADHSYKGTSYMVQGTAADILKQAMLNVDDLFKKWPGCYQLITLHDELIQEIPLKYHSKKLIQEIVQAMQGDFHKILGIPKPLPVSIEITKTCWADSKEVKL